MWWCVERVWGQGSTSYLPPLPSFPPSFPSLLPLLPSLVLTPPSFLLLGGKCLPLLPSSLFLFLYSCLFNLTCLPLYPIIILPFITIHQREDAAKSLSYVHTYIHTCTHVALCEAKLMRPRIYVLPRDTLINIDKRDCLSSTKKNQFIFNLRHRNNVYIQSANLNGGREIRLNSSCNPWQRHKASCTRSLSIVRHGSHGGGARLWWV